MKKKYKMKIWDEFRVPIVSVKGDYDKLDNIVKQLKKKCEK
jgi:hypothetical protein